MNQSRLDLDSPPWSLSIPEAAPLIPMGRRQLREKIERGELYAFRSGRHWKIPKQALKKLLAGEQALPGTQDSARQSLRIVG